MHKKGTRKHTMRKPKKGGYYGMSGAIAPGAALWTRHSEMGNWAVSNRGANAQYGAGKKRKGKKTMKRKQRGRGRFGGVSASYQGTGSRGLADHVGIVTRDGSGAAAQGAFNNFGAQPGSGMGSFIKAH